MVVTILYYFLAFIIFLVCLSGVQKWFRLPQQKKDNIGLVVISLFLLSLLSFTLIIIFKPNFVSTESTAMAMIFFIFFIVVFIAFSIKWYNQKYKKNNNASLVILIPMLSIFGIVFLILKFGNDQEKDKIIQNIALKTTITDITFYRHKPYYKDMMLSDGKYLPMPESMNYKVQIGDSIYKIKGEKFYTIVNHLSKTRTIFEVKTHKRVLGKPD
jgi:hypothetical protein